LLLRLSGFPIPHLILLSSKDRVFFTRRVPAPPDEGSIIKSPWNAFLTPYNNPIFPVFSPPTVHGILPPWRFFHIQLEQEQLALSSGFPPFPQTEATHTPRLLLPAALTFCVYGRSFILCLLIQCPSISTLKIVCPRKTPFHCAFPSVASRRALIWRFC